MEIGALQPQLKIGDIVFIHVDILPFRKIARDTLSWTNHVGIVIDTQGEPLVAESTFPFSTATPISRFIRRSKGGQVDIRRLRQPLSAEQESAIQAAAKKRMKRFYDTGFNLRSRRQFCSRYVHEVVAEALGIRLGEAETLEALFTRNPEADMRFWRLWYFGRIPWQRETITPASLQTSPLLHTVFRGHCIP